MTREQLRFILGHNIIFQFDDHYRDLSLLCKVVDEIEREFRERKEIDEVITPDMVKHLIENDTTALILLNDVPMHARADLEMLYRYPNEAKLKLKYNEVVFNGAEFIHRRTVSPGYFAPDVRAKVCRTVGFESSPAYYRLFTAYSTYLNNNVKPTLVPRPVQVA